MHYGVLDAAHRLSAAAEGLAVAVVLVSSHLREVRPLLLPHRDALLGAGGEHEQNRSQARRDDALARDLPYEQRGVEVADRLAARPLIGPRFVPFYGERQ